MNGDELRPAWGVSDLAAALDCSRKSAYRLLRSGRIRGVQINGRGDWRTTPANVAEYLAGRRTRRAARRSLP